MLQMRTDVDRGPIIAPVWFALGIAYALHALYMKPEMVVTAIERGDYDETEKQYGNTTVKLRVNDLPEFDKLHFEAVVRKALHPFGYVVYLELQHLRIECPRGGQQQLYTNVE